MSRGRPTSLTPEVQSIIVDAITKGVYLETAAALAGVSRMSVWHWVKRGELGEAPYAEFSDAVKRAEAQAELDVICAVRAGGEGWQSKAWIAERRWPHRWSARVHSVVSEQVDSLLAKVKGDPELHERLSRHLEARDRPADAAEQPAH